MLPLYIVILSSSIILFSDRSPVDIKLNVYHLGWEIGERSIGQVQLEEGNVRVGRQESYNRLQRCQLLAHIK